MEFLSEKLEVAEAKESIYWAVQRFKYLSGGTPDVDEQSWKHGHVRRPADISEVRKAEEILSAHGLLRDVLCELAFDRK